MSAWAADGVRPKDLRLPDAIWIDGAYYRHDCNVPLGTLKRKFECRCGRMWRRIPRKELRERAAHVETRTDAE